MDLAFLGLIVSAARGVSDVFFGLQDRQQQLQTRRDSENEMIMGILVDLLAELSKTHTKIVEAIGPLRSLDDNLQTFAEDFIEVYNNFISMYDATDFVNERTHCNKVLAIASRLKRREPHFGSGGAQWDQWDALLHTLDGFYGTDTILIERYYIPFMEDFNNEMTAIKLLADSDTAGAVAKKNAFLNSLGPEFDATKAELKNMTELQAKLIANL